MLVTMGYLWNRILPEKISTIFGRSLSFSHSFYSSELSKTVYVKASTFRIHDAHTEKATAPSGLL